MGRIIIADLESEYMDECLPRPTTDVRPVSPKVVSAVKKDLDKLFRKKSSENEVTVKEDDLAKLVVKLINDHHLCGDYKAALSQFHYDPNDDSKAKVDAMIYPKDRVPEDGRPDWTHSRMFIEFKRGGTKYDPFEDKDGGPVESEAFTRKAVREQLFAYGYNTMLFQHRTAAHALLINGPEFRAMRYDRSGMIATRKVNYVKNPEPLLELFAVFGQLNAEGQGFDPTATLLEAKSAAYKLMDEYAVDPGTDMDYAEGTIISPYTPPAGASSSSTLASASPTPATASSTQATASSKSATAAAKAKISSIVHRLTRKQAKELAAAEEAAAQAVHEHDCDLDIEIPDDDEDPRVFKYVRARFRESLLDGWPRYKLEVGPERRIFLVGKPRFCSVSLLGRGMRGYVALDPKSRRFVFLKDSWRPFYEDVEPEGHYLQILGSGAAKDYVPRLLCHGDVANQVAFTSYYHRHKFPPVLATSDDQPDQEEQSTSPLQLPSSPPFAAPSDPTAGRSSDAEDTDRLGPASERSFTDPQPAEEDDHLPAFRDHRHYRLVSKDVGLAFDCVESVEQLVNCLFHCIIGHGFAYDDHHMIHRDISSGNVLIVPRLESAQDKVAGTKTVCWRGILIDWELAKLVPKNQPDEQAPQPEGKAVSKEKSKSEKARQPERTGTWQFMSVHYVNHQAKLPVTVADELESFFHVLLFFAIRFMRHSIKDSDVPAFVNQYFDSYYPAGGKRLCPPLKTLVVTSGTLKIGGQPILFYVQDGVLHGRFNALVSGLLSYFQARYQVLEWRTPVQRIQESPLSPQEADAATSDKKDLQKLARLINPLRRRKGQDPSERPKAVVKQAPSREVIDLAEKLDTHDAILDEFLWVLRPDNLELPAWPQTGDVVADRLPESYDPRDIIYSLDRLVAAARRATIATTESPYRGEDEPPHKRRRTTNVTGEANIFQATPNDSAAPHASVAPTKGKGRKRRTRD